MTIDPIYDPARRRRQLRQTKRRPLPLPSLWWFVLTVTLASITTVLASWALFTASGGGR